MMDARFKNRVSWKKALRMPAPALAVTAAAVAAVAMYVSSEQAAPFIYFLF